MQWLTLLPAVQGFQDLSAPVALDASALEDTAAGELDELGDEAATAAGSELLDGLEAVPLVDATPDMATPVAPLIPVAPEPAEMLPVETHLPPIAERRAQQQATEDPPRSDAALPMTSPSDKGELIWAAEFVVPENGPESAENEAAQLPALTPAGGRDKGAIAGTQMRQDGSDTDSRQPPSEGQSPERGPGGNSSPAETFEVSAPSVAPQGNTPVEFKVAGTTTEAASTPAVGSVELDIARPLRPAQIATLYVDVPAPDGAAPMKLAVSQRGDQVNVRLRSWDAASAPLDSDRMQPLLQSLAEQGYAASRKSIDRLDENSPMPVEHLRDRPLALNEAANSNNDQQPFQNADDRQRKNQERQQQAFLLRRQMRNLNTEQFDLQAQLEGQSSSQQLGAFR